MAENLADPHQLDTHSVSGHYVEVEGGLPEAGMGCNGGGQRGLYWLETEDGDLATRGLEEGMARTWCP